MRVYGHLKFPLIASIYGITNTCSISASNIKIYFKYRMKRNITCKFILIPAQPQHRPSPQCNLHHQYTPGKIFFMILEISKQIPFLTLISSSVGLTCPVYTFDQMLWLVYFSQPQLVTIRTAT